MITMLELIGLHTIADIPLEHQHNLETLLKVINIVRAEWGKPMQVTSGYRSLQEHLRIYSQKGINDRNKIPMKSNHLIGCAVDISDPKLELTNWLKSNNILEQCKLFCEDGNSNWVHFQTVPPKSGARWFLP
jgi:hypothetical protein